MSAARADTALFKRLRNVGVRKRVARQISRNVNVSGSGSGSGQHVPKEVRDAIEALREVTTEVEDWARGGPAKRKAAAIKATDARERNAKKPSKAAKKAAAARARPPQGRSTAAGTAAKSGDRKAGGNSRRGEFLRRAEGLNTDERLALIKEMFPPPDAD